MTGRVLLLVGAVAAGAAVPLALVGGRRGRRGARGLLVTSAVALALALGSLATSMVTGDFALVYVADHARRDASAWYRLAGLWGGMEGSLLLWTALLAGFAVLATAGRRAAAAADGRGAGATLAVLAGSVAAFATTTALTADPFRTLRIPATDGGGLLPILEHPAMVVHPPLLYAGLVSTVVPFALTVGAVAGPLDGAWRARARRWLLVSWVLLVLGMATGSNWAYVELGWGGYWAWDPIENTALLPWLAATAALHLFLAAGRPIAVADPAPAGALVEAGASHPSGAGGAAPTPLADPVAASPTRAAAGAGAALLPWVLAVLGTTITRSGAAVSVHAFAESDAVTLALTATWVGVVAVAACAVVVAHRRARPAARGHGGPVAAAGLAGGRRPTAAGTGPGRGPGSVVAAEPVAAAGEVAALAGTGAGGPAGRRRPAPVDRELLLRAQVAVGLAAVVVVAAGTVTPVVRAQLGGPTGSTTGDFFAAWTAPLLWAALALVVVGPALAPGDVLTRARLGSIAGIPVLAGLAVAVVVASQGWTAPRTLVTAGLAGAAGASAIRLAVTANRARAGGRGAGAHLAHLGVAVLVLGLAGATAGSDRTASLADGASATVGGVVVRNGGVRTDPGTDGNPRVIARITVERGGRARLFEPEIVGYPERGVRLAETALWSDPTGDVQLALRTADDEGRVLLDVHVRPLTPLVWWGAALLALGGALAAASRVAGERIHRTGGP